MYWRSWIGALLLCMCSGLYPASVDCAESNTELYKTHVSGVCEKHPTLNWDDVLLTESEKNAHHTITDYPNFTNNPRITSRMQRLMAPYLLPLDSPIKSICDKIFPGSHVIQHKKSLKKAGFRILFAQKLSHIIVASHPKLSGYLFKIYLHSERVYKDRMVGWELLTTRCIVAQKIKSIIKQKKIRNFVVADKWLYPLPASKKKQKVEPVILIVKDMKIYDRHKSREVWEHKAKPKYLKELYAILGRGYGSAFLPGNIPYTKSGKFAFIDTEYMKRKIPLGHVKHFLSSAMKEYWDHLVVGAPKKRGIYLNAELQ